MSTEYTKTNWQDGDIITADKMNNIENGVKGIEGELSTVKDGLTAMSTATTSDEGKALKAKTVAGGKVTEWEFGEAGGDDIDIHVDGTALVINTSVINGNEVSY